MQSLNQVQQRMSAHLFCRYRSALQARWAAERAAANPVVRSQRENQLWLYARSCGWCRLSFSCFLASYPGKSDTQLREMLRDKVLKSVIESELNTEFDKLGRAIEEADYMGDIPF